MHLLKRKKLVLAYILKSFPFVNYHTDWVVGIKAHLNFFDIKLTSNSIGDMRYILCLIAILFKTATVMSNGKRRQKKIYQVLQQPDVNYLNQKYSAGQRRNVIPDMLSLCMYTIAFLDSSQRHRAYYFQKVPTIKVT